MTTKYRRPLLVDELPYKQTIFDLIQSCNISGYIDVPEINCDRHHIHFILESRPITSPSSIIKYTKQITTHILWEKYENELRKEFWKTRLFWSPSYFIATVDMEVVKKYIENQGENKKSKLKKY